MPSLLKKRITVAELHEIVINQNQVISELKNEIEELKCFKETYERTLSILKSNDDLLQRFPIW